MKFIKELKTKDVIKLGDLIIWDDGDSWEVLDLVEDICVGQTYRSFRQDYENSFVYRLVAASAKKP